MGADLYIQSIHDKLRAEFNPLFDEACAKRDEVVEIFGRQGFAYEAAQEKVLEYLDKMNADGYFRDNYNENSLLWLFGLSWWEDIGGWLDSKGNLSPEDCQSFIKMLFANEQTFFTNLNAHIESLKTNNPYNEDPKEVEEYHMEHYGKLLEFLEKAIKLGEPVACSI